MDKQIISCNCGGNLIDPEKMEAVEEMLAGLGIEFVKVSDLCGLCSIKKEEAIRLFSSSATVRHKLITGVTISVCKSNIDMALSEKFVCMLHDMGVIYLWYYI